MRRLAAWVCGAAPTPRPTIRQRHARPRPRLARDAAVPRRVRCEALRCLAECDAACEGASARSRDRVSFGAIMPQGIMTVVARGGMRIEDRIFWARSFRGQHFCFLFCGVSLIARCKFLLDFL